MQFLNRNALISRDNCKYPIFVLNPVVDEYRVAMPLLIGTTARKRYTMKLLYLKVAMPLLIGTTARESNIMMVKYI